MLFLATNFNPRSLTGATKKGTHERFRLLISIHAPLRERQEVDFMNYAILLFQSTLPYGSDVVLFDIVNHLI